MIGEDEAVFRNLWGMVVLMKRQGNVCGLVVRSRDFGVIGNGTRAM